MFLEETSISASFESATTTSNEDSGPTASVTSTSVHSSGSGRKRVFADTVSVDPNAGCDIASRLGVDNVP